MSDYNFIIDIQSRRLVADYFSTEAGTPPSIVFGDQPTVNVQLVEANNDSADYPWKSVALTGQSIRVGVGSLEDATPSAYIELTADLAAASSVITEIRTGVLNTTNEIQRVQILDAVKGNYTLTIAGETTTPLCLDASLEEITDAVEALASITADSVEVTGNPTDYRVEFDSSLADVGAITVNLDNITSRVGKTGTLDLHVTEILTLLDDETTVEATLEVVQWTTADVAGETVLQVPVTITQDVIPDTVPSTTPLPGYATIDLDHINQSGAATGQIPTWNGTEWVPSTVSGTGDLLSTANLSDLADIPTARTNLGLGTAATTAATDYATAAQGTTADSALQSSDIDTLAELNAIVADATIVETTDSRLSDARTPTAHTHTASDIDAEASTDGYVLTSDGAGNAAWEVVSGGGGGASQLSDLSDVNTSTPTNRNALIADGVDFESRALVEADISDLHNAVSIAASGGRDYVTISGTQQLTLHTVDLTADVSGDLPVADGGTGASDATTARTNLGVDAAGTDNSTDVTLAGEDFLSLAGQQITANAIDLDNLSATGTPSATTYLRGDNTWATVSGSGDVVKVGTPVDNEIGVWTGDGTLEGDTNFTWDGATLDVTGEVIISKTATQADEHGVEINYNAAGFGDAKALDIVYTTGAIVTGQDEASILVNIDETAATGGSIFGLEVLTTDGAADKVCGMKVGAVVAPICQESGTFANPTTGTNNTASTDVAAMIDGSEGTNTNIFVADNDFIIIGAAASFTEIEFILQTLVANPGITPTFAYSTAGAGQFTTFSPTDGTNGFTNNGVVAWNAGDLTGHTTNDDTGTFDIKITRTNNTKGNASLYYAKTAATVSYQWDESGVVTVASAVVDDEAYSGSWDASLEVPTKNAIYDKIEALPCEIGIACGDETTVPAASTSVAAVTFTMPYAMTLTEVMASVVVAPTTTTVIVDIHDGATTIMGTNKLDILTTAFVDDNTATLSDTALAKDAIITVYVDQTDVAVAGLKIWLIGTRT